MFERLYDEGVVEVVLNNAARRVLDLHDSFLKPKKGNREVSKRLRNIILQQLNSRLNSLPTSYKTFHIDALRMTHCNAISTLNSFHCFP